MKKTLILIGSFFILFNQFVFSQNILEDKYDVKQYILDLQISNSSTVISGNVIINAKVNAISMDTFVVDLIDTIVANQTYMVVDSVFVNGVSNVFQHHNDFIFIPLTTAIPQNQAFSAQIYYHGNGHNSGSIYYNYNGIYTKTYSGNTQSYSLGEPFGAKIWFPVKQVLTDKADSVTFYITTDSTNITGSNGLLISKTTLSNGKCKYKWVTHYPIAYYLISFVVGRPYEEKTYYTPLTNQDSVLMQNFLIYNSTYYPIHLVALEKTNELMYLYSEIFGTYPFKNEKYGNCVIGVGWDGMEHQTLSTMGYLSLDTTMTDLGVFYCWVTAHEFAHHWFGDYVTCATWNDVWLNEGLGSYVEYIALQNIEGQFRADLWINAYHTYIKSSPGGSVYVPNSQLLNPARIFDARLSYCKGAAVTHMLRYEINNDSIFFTVLRNFLSAHAYANATTDDFKQSVETTTSNNFTDFFNQWIYGEGYPTFNINWSQNNDTLTITSNQTTSTSITTLFKTHFDLKINYATADTIIRLFQGTNNETYKIYFPELVDSIEMDPNFWLIQKNFIITGIEKNNISFSFEVFPNPAKNNITIELNQVSDLQNNIISIYDIQGQLLIQQRVLQNNLKMDISMLEKGVYIVKLNNNKQFAVSKFVKM